MLKYKNKSLRRWCRENNVNYDTVRSRIYKQGLSIEEAVSKIVVKTPKYDGKSLRKWCLEKGYDYKKIYSRMYYKNLTPEEALKFEKKTTYMIDNKSLLSYMKERGYSIYQYRSVIELIKRNNYSTKEGYKKWIERKLSKKLKK